MFGKAGRGASCVTFWVTGPILSILYFFIRFRVWLRCLKGVVSHATLCNRQKTQEVLSMGEVPGFLETLGSYITKLLISSLASRLRG